MEAGESGGEEEESQTGLMDTPRDQNTLHTSSARCDKAEAMLLEDVRVFPVPNHLRLAHQALELPSSPAARHLAMHRQTEPPAAAASRMRGL